MSSQGSKKHAASECRDADNRVVANAALARNLNQSESDGRTTSQTMIRAVTKDHHATRLGTTSAGVPSTKKRTLLPDTTVKSRIPYKTRNVVGKRFADEVSFVFFDLETGGFRYLEHDILQISAVCGDKEFNVYIEPTRPIPREASNVNKLTLLNGKLHYEMNPVETVPIKEALQQFIKFLREIPKPELVGHYSKKFDLPFLKHYLKENDMWETFQSLVAGYIDTWIAFRQEFPNRSSYKQVDLVRGLLGEEYEAHNALEDARTLQKLCELKKEKLLDYRFGAKEIGI